MISIRLLSLDDLDLYYNMINDDRENLSIMPTVYTMTREKAQLDLEATVDPQNKILLYGIFLLDKIIGSIEISDVYVSDRPDGHNLGYFIIGEHRGRNYMKTALQLIIELHKDNLPFYAEVFEDNAPSLWLLWGLGFKEDCRWKQTSSSPTFVRLVYKRHLS